MYTFLKPQAKERDASPAPYGKWFCRQSAKNIVRFTFTHLKQPKGHIRGREEEAGGHYGATISSYQDKLSLLVNVHFPSDNLSGQGEVIEDLRVYVCLHVQR